MGCCGPDGAGARDYNGSRVCIGSSCMGWRWDFRPKDVEIMKSDPDVPKVPHGHCGVAGPILQDW